MRVLHISYSDKNGGAAIGAYRLHLAMRSRGVESEMFVIRKESSDISVRSLVNPVNQPEYAAALQATAELRELYGVVDAPIRSLNIHGLDLADAINKHPCEIVQLHWIANNTLKLSDLPKIKKPIVWKMPDMWAFSGGEHYIRHGDPERHVEGYDKLGPFNGEAADVDRFVWDAKRKHFQNLSLTITSPSRFLAHEAHRSKLLGGYDAHVIPNPLPWQFLMGKAPQESERQSLRKQFGLPAEKLVVMFSAFNSKERRKGFHHIEEMVAGHLQKVAPPSRLAFIVCGAEEPGRSNIANYDVFKFEATQDVDLYKKYLRASDLLLFPSEMDSTAMVVQEALSQGVPSIVFDVGGLPEMVEHEKNGYVAAPYDAAGLADGIAWWLKCADREGAADFAIERARAMHDPAKTVARYLEVYDAALSRFLNDGDFKTGVLHSEPAPVEPLAEKCHAFIVDPSAVNFSDSSHHSEHVSAFAALFQANGIEPVMVVNAEARFDNPFGETIKKLKWTAYDKIRIDQDRRNGPAIDPESVRRADADSQKSFETYEVLKQLSPDRKLTWRDAIVFPTTDRFCVEGALGYIYAHQEYDSPSFHFNVMFEKADFLLGKYPLERLMQAMQASTYVNKKIFLYAETQQMADDLSARYGVEFRRLPPPGLFTEAQLQSVAATPGYARAKKDAVRDAYTKACSMADAGSASGALQRFLPPSDKRIIVSLGRGRRDKGWGALPDIVEAFNNSEGADGAVFVVQRPRKMDGLDSQEARMEKFRNVMLLDEIIPQSMLDDVCSKADVFLLPYEVGVYRNRGSAFGWRAVLNAKPLVVTAGTALRETLLPNDASGQHFANGKTANGAAEFAKALQGVLSDLPTFNQGAERMRANYFDSIVTRNPIVTTMREENLAADRHVLVLRSGNDDLLPDEASEGFRVDLTFGEATVDDIWLSDVDSAASLALNATLRDGALDPDALPAFVRASLEGRRITKIYAPSEFAIAHGGLRLLPPDWLAHVELY